MCCGKYEMKCPCKRHGRHPTRKRVSSSLTTWWSMHSYPYEADAPVFVAQTNFGASAPGSERPIFTIKLASGHPFFVFRGHTGASVSKNVGVEGHPFLKNVHPLNQNTIFRGHQAQLVPPFKILKGDPAECAFWQGL